MPGGPRAPIEAPARRCRILVVDDDALVGRALARLLSREHDVEVLVSGLTAAARIEGGERWDVILCDLLMPEISGMELARRVERTAPEVGRRMVFMTGGAYTDEARRFLESGRRWIEKPIDPATLRGVVRQVGEGSAAGAAR